MINRSLESKGLQRILPKGGAWGLFGWHTVHPKDKEIIITEGEFDCMAVKQALMELPQSDPLSNVPVVSFPNGCNSLPNSLLPLLSRFDKIYLWLDNDKSGLEATEKFVLKLGPERCLIVNPGSCKSIDPMNTPKDANDALRQSPQILIDILRAAKDCSNKNIESFSNFRNLFLSEIENQNISPYVGTTTNSLMLLTEACKGFRKGELIVVSGPTGSGKTTFLSQITLDFVNEVIQCHIYCIFR